MSVALPVVLCVRYLCLSVCLSSHSRDAHSRSATAHHTHFFEVRTCMALHCLFAVVWAKLLPPLPREPANTTGRWTLRKIEPSQNCYLGGSASARCNHFVLSTAGEKRAVGVAIYLRPPFLSGPLPDGFAPLGKVKRHWLIDSHVER